MKLLRKFHIQLDSIKMPLKLMKYFAIITIRHESRGNYVYYVKPRAYDNLTSQFLYLFILYSPYIFSFLFLTLFIYLEAEVLKVSYNFLKIMNIYAKLLKNLTYRNEIIYKSNFTVKNSVTKLKANNELPMCLLLANRQYRVYMYAF